MQNDVLGQRIDQLRNDLHAVRTLPPILKWVSDNPFGLAPDAPKLAHIGSDIIRAAAEYLNLLLFIDGTLLYLVAPVVRAEAERLAVMADSLGELDAAISVASFRCGLETWTRPTFLADRSPARFEDVVHPLVPSPVPNTALLCPPHRVLITGSNMSGKSTWLRAVGVNAVLAQTIYTCTAAEFAGPRFTVRTFIVRSDDVTSGKSYYAAELGRVADLLSHSESAVPHLFILDELFRGTNAVERIAIGEAVLRALASSGHHLVLAATHDGELVDLLDGVFAPFHFQEDSNDDGLAFSYRLTEGRSTSRNAIALLRLSGASADVVANAFRTAAMLDRQRAWSPQL